MDAQERRAEKRVRPPGDAVLDFALWPARLPPPSRLPIEKLGPPAACRRAGDRLVLADIAAIGLGLRLSAAPDVAGRLAAAPALDVYLRLRDYRPHAPNGWLSLFFHAQTARVLAGPDALLFGLRLLRQGRGSSFEKALELLDISRFGAPELAAWVDAVTRNAASPSPMAGPGLELDRLLDEPALALPPPDRTRNTP